MQPSLTRQGVFPVDMSALPHQTFRMQTAENELKKSEWGQERWLGS